MDSILQRYAYARCMGYRHDAPKSILIAVFAIRIITSHS
jgi:hypothetical protein